MCTPIANAQLYTRRGTFDIEFCRSRARRDDGYALELELTIRDLCGNLWFPVDGFVAGANSASVRLSLGSNGSWAVSHSDIQFTDTTDGTKCRRIAEFVRATRGRHSEPTVVCRRMPSAAGLASPRLTEK